MWFPFEPKYQGLERILVVWRISRDEMDMRDRTGSKSYPNIRKSLGTKKQGRTSGLITDIRDIADIRELGWVQRSETATMSGEGYKSQDGYHG